MKSIRQFVVAFTLGVILFLRGSGVAQSEPPPASINDSFRKIKDTEIHDALTTLSHADMAWWHSGSFDRRELPGLYNKAENERAIGIVLAAAERGYFQDNWNNWLSVRGSVQRTVDAAVISGAIVHIPLLKKLSYNPDKRLRDAVADPGSLLLSPSPSLEVLKECILSAETRLPASLANQKASQASLNEFEDRVKTFCSFSNAEERKTLIPIVSRVLSRYDDEQFKQFYTSRFQKLLQVEIEKR